MSVGYEVLFDFLSLMPPKSIQNVLERMNHGSRINMEWYVTEFQATKTLLIRLPRFWRSVFRIERILHARRYHGWHSL